VRSAAGALAIRPGLDPAQLRRVFDRLGRLHIPDILDPRGARRIEQALAGPAPWIRSVNVGAKSYDLGPEAFAAMPPERRQELEAAIAQGARSGFQYQFDTYRLSDLIEGGSPPDGALEVLDELYRFLNGPEFLGFVRILTGEVAGGYVDAQATRYGPGDFLTSHDDDVEGKNRLFAYVLNFTRGWRAEWGGLLLFHDADGHIAEGYTPSFNALNIFRVPQRHSVSQVGSFVTAPRLSVTGWIRRGQ
jgi:SM-20-related protein